MEILILVLISSPGDSIGWTYYDYQTSGNVRQMVWVDNPGNIHADFMRAHEPNPWYDRKCAYNFKKAGGKWYGDMCISSERSGYAALGVKSNGAAVCAYQQMRPGDVYSCWIAVDEGPGQYTFTEHRCCPQNTKRWLWPAIAVDDQDYFHVLGHTVDEDNIYYSRSTDDGNTWTDLVLINTDNQATSLGYDIFADRWQSPGYVMMVWLEKIPGSQIGQNVWINISTDNGETWQGPQNITNFTTSDTMAAFADCRPIFDRDGNPHVVFTAGYYQHPNLYIRSWIMHWSPSTGLTTIAGPFEVSGQPQAWCLSCNDPTLAVDTTNGYLYCIYHGFRDENQAQNGFYNAELYAMVSTDGGQTWGSNTPGDTGVNLTNTPGSNSAPGQGEDEEYHSVHPYVVNFPDSGRSSIITYIEDKDPGSTPHGQGAETENPWRCYIVRTARIGVEEGKPEIPQATRLLGIYPNPARNRVRVRFTLRGDGRVRLGLYDITGRLIERLLDERLTKGYHTKGLRFDLPCGVYFIEMEVEGYKGVERLILLR